jgi:ferredoxin/flavodoxin---NADP+ reductase
VDQTSTAALTPDRAWQPESDHGMCGGCRITVGGKTMFAGVDGPEFDAHGVDFDELTRRNRAYADQERTSRERHECMIGLGK